MNRLIQAARIVLGLIFTIFGLDYFIHFLPELPFSKAGGAFLEALLATGYLFPLIKTIEVACGLLLLSGYCVPLALCLLAPVVVNILCYHAFLDPNGATVAAVVGILEVALLFVYRESFRSLFVVSPRADSQTVAAGRNPIAEAQYESQ